MIQPPPVPASPGRHATAFVFVTVLVDGMGIGIIIPVLPGLIRELTALSLSQAALWGGFLTLAYALMQFVLGPTVGNLSDRFGRRPVLLVSLAIMAVDYLIMAVAPSLWVLFLGRLIAGAAGATHSTANAFVADISPPEKRAQNFGLMGAGFGIGFIVGPIIGGLAGELSTRAPFYAAAAIAFGNFCYGAIVLPETLDPANRRPFSWIRANPLGVAMQIAKVPMVAWFVLAFFMYNLAQYAYPAVWSFYTQEAFGWSTGQVGLSLALWGVGFALVQGWLIRLVLPRIGEAMTALLGFLVSILGLVALSFATEGWMVYAIIPITALGAILAPALTGLMANRVPDNAQGELQGALSSVTGITMIVTPVLMTQLFGYFTAASTPLYFPGAPFLAAAVIMALAMLPFAIGLRTVAR
ncbi:MAG: TCR/Tet family MFS transporter [Alphaproteobacteria bacterium]|nr:TCR/Tet family MFS transporter [Alphaproteobacteria bacterium]